MVQMCQLISLVRPMAYEDLYWSIVQPIHRMFFRLTVNKQSQIINMWRRMVLHWLRYDWRILGPGTSSQEQLSSAGPSFFSPMPTGVDYYRSLREVISYVDRLCGLALIASGDHPLLMNTILDFVDVMARLHSVHGLPFTVRPSRNIVYRCFLAPHGVGISRICDVIAQYKVEMSRLKRSQQSGASMEGLSFPSGVEEISMINNYIMDISYCLWHEWAFSEKVDRTKTFLFDAPIANVAKFGTSSQRRSFMSLALASSLSGLSSLFLQSLPNASI